MDNKMTAEQALESIEYAGHCAEQSGLIDCPERIRDAIPVLRAALSAPRVAAVPDGWKLVPVEPTARILTAGYSARQDMLKRFALSGALAPADDGMRAAYAAMLTASPEPVAPDAQQVIADLRAEVQALKAEKDALVDLSNGLDKMYRKLWKVIALSVWQLAWCPGKVESVIKTLRKSISDAARLREGGE